MQRGFLVESLQKAIFTECYVCIFQTDCCRRRGAQEGSRHDWNESQPRVGRMKPNTIQAGRKRCIHSFRVFLFLLLVLLFFFSENQTAHSINFWNCTQGENLQFRRKLLPKTTIKWLRPELFKLKLFAFTTCVIKKKKKKLDEINLLLTDLPNFVFGYKWKLFQRVHRSIRPKHTQNGQQGLFND